MVEQDAIEKWHQKFLREQEKKVKVRKEISTRRTKRFKSFVAGIIKRKPVKFKSAKFQRYKIRKGRFEVGVGEQTKIRNMLDIEDSFFR